MQVKSIAECSILEHSAILLTCIKGSILQYFWPALSDNRSWNPILVFFVSGRLRQVLLYIKQGWYFKALKRESSALD